jgi:nicotinamidase-related amidase
MSPTSKTSVLPSGGGKGLLDPSDVAILLLDHQSGLFQTVKDIPVADLRRNTAALAKLATLFKIPVITTASEPNGPNGPLMPEIAEAAPHAVFVPRKGEVSAWDSEDFVAAVPQHRPQDSADGRRVDERVRDVPGARRQGQRLQRVRDHRRLG